MRIALAWIYNSETGTYWHNGAISGYSSYAFFNPKGDYAAIILVNNAPGPIPFSELLAQHIRQRLAGEPAVSFANVVIPRERWISEADSFIRGLLGHHARLRRILPHRAAA